MEPRGGTRMGHSAPEVSSPLSLSMAVGWQGLPVRCTIHGILMVFASFFGSNLFNSLASHSRSTASNHQKVAAHTIVPCSIHPELPLWR